MVYTGMDIQLFSDFKYRIMALMKVETEIVASIAASRDRTSRDTSGSDCRDLQN